MKRVAFLIYDGFLLLDMSGPAEAFCMCNRSLPVDDQYELVTVAESSNPVTAYSGVKVVPDFTLSELNDGIDILLVPGGPGAYDCKHPMLYKWLRNVVDKTELYGSVCTGTFMLGSAGLLDGHLVTTHWNYIKRLKSAFSDCHVENDQIIVRDGKLITCGGITAGIDLALAIIESDHGREKAIKVAKILLVSIKRQGGQAQFTPMLSEVTRIEGPIFQVKEFILTHLSEDFSIRRMAALANMSVRTFTRQFKEELGVSPATFIQSARIDHARKLLENTDLPVKTIAFASGFGTVRQMQSLFNRKLGVSPLQYRRQFG